MYFLILQIDTSWLQFTYILNFQISQLLKINHANLAQANPLKTLKTSKPPNRPNCDDDDDNDDQCVVCFSTLGRVDRVDVQATGRGQFVPYTRLDQDKPSQTILFERPLKV